MHPMNEKAAHAGAATQLNSARSFPGDASSERKSSSSIGTREENSNSKRIHVQIQVTESAQDRAKVTQRAQNEPGRPDPNV